MDFGQLLGRLHERPMVRKFHQQIPAERILEPDFPIRPFEPGKAYFRIRLAEMFLRNRGELLRDFIPLTMIASEFFYDGERRSVPFVVGNQSLDEALRDATGKEFVELFDTTVAGPIPYMSEPLGLFVGLFRTEVNDLASGLFGLVTNLATSFDAAHLNEYLKVGDVLQAGIRDILGMKQVEFCFGRRNELSSTTGGTAFQSGYLLYVNIDEQALDATRFWVRDGRLYQGDSEKTLRRYTEQDYCLLAIENLPHRKDHAELEFHRLFADAQDLIWSDNLEQARLLGLSRLAKAVVKSPDLIDADKTDLLEMYKGNFEAEVNRYLAFKRPSAATRGSTRGTTRGGSRGMSGKAMLQKMAGVAERSRASDVARLAYQGALEFDALYHPAEGQRVKLDAARVETQLAAIRARSGRTRPNPQALADVIVADNIDTLEG